MQKGIVVKGITHIGITQIGITRRGREEGLVAESKTKLAPTGTRSANSDFRAYL